MKKIITDFTLIVLAFLSGFLFNTIITRINGKFGNDRLKFRLSIFKNEVIQINVTGKESVSGESYE